jgi:hypothetical protein
VQLHHASSVITTPPLLLPRRAGRHPDCQMVVGADMHVGGHHTPLRRSVSVGNVPIPINSMLTFME